MTSSCSCVGPRSPNSCWGKPLVENEKLRNCVEHINCPRVPSKVKNTAQIITIFIGLIVMAIGAYYFHHSYNSERQTNVLVHQGVLTLGVGINFMNGMVAFGRYVSGDFENKEISSGKKKSESPNDGKTEV